VGLQAFQAALAGRRHALFRRVVRVDLRNEEHFIAPPADRLAHQFLGAPVAVHLRGVDQRGARIEAGAQRGDLLGALRAHIADVPGTEAERRYLLARGQRHGLHAASWSANPWFTSRWCASSARTAMMTSRKRAPGASFQ